MLILIPFDRFKRRRGVAAARHEQLIDHAARVQRNGHQAAILWFTGLSGSGKSTFMRCLVGLVPPDAGVAAVDGVDLARDGVAVRRRLTYTPGDQIGQYTRIETARWINGGVRFLFVQAQEQVAVHSQALFLQRRLETTAPGLTAADAEKRLIQDGHNRLRPPRFDALRTPEER